MSHKFRFWLIFVFSAVSFFTPLAVEERVGLGLDKVVHAFLFFLLVYFAFQAYPERKVLSVILLLLYTVATEFIQESYIPHRSFDVYDIVADTAGIIAGAIYTLTKRERSFVPPWRDEG